MASATFQNTVYPSRSNSSKSIESMEAEAEDHGSHHEHYQGAADQEVFQYQQTAVTLPVVDAAVLSGGDYQNEPVLIRRIIGTKETDDDEPIIGGRADSERTSIENLTDHL